MHTEQRSLLEDLMPGYDVRTRHNTIVHASAEACWAALESLNMREAPFLTRMLFRARGLRTPPGRFRTAVASTGFRLLAETPGRELVFGIAGRFWALREAAALKPLRDAAHARDYDEPGAAVGTWAFRIEPNDDGTTLLETETRVRCVDDRARRRFRAYWTVIGPFSGLIRRELLRTVKEKAES